MDMGKFELMKMHVRQPRRRVPSWPGHGAVNTKKEFGMKKSEWFLLFTWVNFVVLTWLGLLGIQFAVNFWVPWVAFLVISVVGTMVAYGEAKRRGRGS